MNLYYIGMQFINLQDRLNGLSMLAIHNDIEVEIDEILDILAQKPRKQEMLW